MSDSGSMTHGLVPAVKASFSGALQSGDTSVDPGRVRGYFVYDIMCSVGPLSPNDLWERRYKNAPIIFSGDRGGARRWWIGVDSPVVATRVHVLGNLSVPTAESGVVS